MTVTTFYVAKGESCGNLLSLNTAQELGLVRIHVDKLTTKDRALETIPQKNNEVFSGLGKLNGEKIKLDIDQTKIPKAQLQLKAHSLPYSGKSENGANRVRKSRDNRESARKRSDPMGITDCCCTKERWTGAYMRRYATGKRGNQKGTTPDTYRY